MAYYQNGSLFLEPGDAGYAGPPATLPREERRRYDFGDGVWHAEDERVTHEFGWRAGVLSSLGAEAAASNVVGIARGYGLGCEMRTARTLLGSSHAYFTVTGPAGKVAAFVQEIASYLGEG